MSKLNIAKFSAFVIFFLIVLLETSGCVHSEPVNSAEPARSHYGTPLRVGTIASHDVTESSGLAASRCQPNVFWTHNDHGDDAFIYGLDQSGANLGTWKVSGAQNDDWEDIAEYKDGDGKCWIYLGDTGDNHLKRDQHTIYRVHEPTVSSDSANTTRENALTTDTAEALPYVYPDGRHNAETLMVHPSSGDIYVVSKIQEGPASLYKLKPVFGNANPVTAEKIADISVPRDQNGYVTGGDISPDGRRAIICDYVGGYELTLPDGDTSFDDIWKQPFEKLDLGDRPHGEGICYTADGNALVASSEGKKSPIFRIERKP